MLERFDLILLSLTAAREIRKATERNEGNIVRIGHHCDGRRFHLHDFGLKLIVQIFPEPRIIHKH